MRRPVRARLTVRGCGACFLTAQGSGELPVRFRFNRKEGFLYRGMLPVFRWSKVAFPNRFRSGSGSVVTEQALLAVLVGLPVLADRAVGDADRFRRLRLRDGRVGLTERL